MESVAVPFQPAGADSKYWVVVFEPVEGVMKITPPPGPVSPTAYTCEKLICAEVAAKYVESAAIETVNRHVPAATNDTAPVVEFTVHTCGEDDEYVFAPVPEAVEVTVGGLAAMR